jgi:hypothetical protein
MARFQRKFGSWPPTPEEQKPDDSLQRKHATRIEKLFNELFNDPEWQPLAEYIRKKFGEPITLHWGQVRRLIHCSLTGRLPPNLVTITIPELLALLSLWSPKRARLLLDDVLDNRHEKRQRPTAERNAIWKRWHDEDGIGPTAIARRWKEETGECVEPNAVKQALRRTGRSE